MTFLVKGIGVCSRSMRCVNFLAPNSGLRGVPVGTAAKALRAKGLRPFFQARAPPTVKISHLKGSRRVI